VSAPRIVIAEWLWDGSWSADGALMVADGAVRPATPDEVAAAAPDSIERVPGSVMPPLTDCHVHLDLVDAAAVAEGGLARVLDLGGNPGHDLRAGDVEVVRAGQILTAVGGYPSTRQWAADAMFREVGPGDAQAAVREQATMGAQVIKIALNSDAGPVWPDDLVAEVVGAAHAWSLPVVAHVEGVGEAARAATAGADVFAHAPFNEELDHALLKRFAATTTWISTLRIHTGRDRERAVGNAARFHAAGGRILYGTDMGNGPSSGGIESDELKTLASFGLTGDALLEALTGGGLLPRWGATVSRVDAPPVPGTQIASWLSGASVGRF
jgi:imidazolonepropionase-like amidohydrolase